MSEAARVRAAAAALRDHGLPAPAAAIVLGSGLEDFGAGVDVRHRLAFGDVPGWAAPGVEGHGGELLAGRVEGLEVACLSGRLHLYEGHPPADVVRPVRTLVALGARAVLLTNAAGGIARGLAAGDLMVIRDHVNLTGRSALVGPHEPELGPRFPAQDDLWCPRLRAVLHRADPDLREGVYAGMLGPSYETPAEVAMLSVVGASAVGMSTVLEATAASAMGARVAGLSLISNLAAGIAATPPSHDEVIAAGRAAAARMTAVVRGFCAQLAGGPAARRGGDDAEQR